MVEYESLDDHQLIERISIQEKPDLEALYGRYMLPAYSLAMFMLKQQALPEEAAGHFPKHLTKSQQLQA